MLSSTAKNLYWMGRYLQRAKTTTRLIEATQRMVLQSGEEAEGVVAVFGMEDEFRQTQSQGGRLANMIDFLAFDESNPSSIVSSISARHCTRSRRASGRGEACGSGASSMPAPCWRSSPSIRCFPSIQSILRESCSSPRYPMPSICGVLCFRRKRARNWRSRWGVVAPNCTRLASYARSAASIPMVPEGTPAG